MRIDGRNNYALRPMQVELDYSKYAEGSVLISFGDTKVLCTATIEERVPIFLKNSGTGWVTAEYSMLPRATETRNIRESSKGKPSGRTQEIQRIIGRALRAAVDFKTLGERTIFVDCDVVQADGGTRTTSINGAFIATLLAIDRLIKKRALIKSPIKSFLAAISVGVVNGEVLLDLNYKEDSSAAVDMNVVATEDGKFVEIQGTAEEDPFSDVTLSEMLEVAKMGISEIIEMEKEIIKNRLDLNQIIVK